jgi:tetratricopeptide (TPR) repeat protein
MSLTLSGYEIATGQAETKAGGGTQFWENLPSEAAKVQVEEGDRCARKGLYSAAIRHYREAIRMMPTMAEAHNNLAWLYVTCDDPNFRNPQAALRHARRAVELTAWKDVASIDTLAEAYYANRDYGKAVKVEAKALLLAPRNRDLQQHMTRYRNAAGLRELSAGSGRRPSAGRQQEEPVARALANDDNADRVPLLWIVPCSCAVLVLLGLFGLPRWPALVASLAGLGYLAYFAVISEQQLTDPRNTGGILAHRWLWGFWGCWLGLIAPAVVALFRPSRPEG